MTTPDVNVFVLDFPNYEKEMVIPNEDGSYTIMINARLSIEQQTKSYKHAMEHIQNQDFEKSDVQEIEAQTHHIQPVKKEFDLNVEKIAQPRKNRRFKRTTAKQWKEARERSEFMQNYDPDYFLKRAEYHKLYRGI